MTNKNEKPNSIEIAYQVNDKVIEATIDCRTIRVIDYVFIISSVCLFKEWLLYNCTNIEKRRNEYSLQY